MRNSHCSYCGNKFEDTPWPRTCAQCKKISYINPLPVVVLLVPILSRDGRIGILTVRRGEDPNKGEFALPGGYLDVGELWEAGAARELKEETGIIVDVSRITAFAVETSLQHNNILIFGSTALCSNDVLNSFTPNHEVTELLVIHEPRELAFPTHTKTVNRFFPYLFKNLQ